MRRLKHLFRVMVADNGENITEKLNDVIIDGVEDSLFSWDYGNKNEETTQWNSCKHNNFILLAVNEVPIVDYKEVKNNIISILEEELEYDDDIDFFNKKLDVSIEYLGEIDIYDQRVATCVYDYSNEIIRAYSNILKDENKGESELHTLLRKEKMNGKLQEDDSWKF